MAFLSTSNRSIAIPKDLTIFAPPLNQVAVKKIRYEECRPVSSLSTDDTPVEIYIPGQSNDYLDLRKCRLYVKAKITKADGSNLADREKCGIINMPASALFSSMDLYLNDTLVTCGTNTYPWEAYLKVLLSNSKETLESQLQTQLFYEDSKNLDETDVPSGGNPGLLKRYVFTQMSRIFDLEGPLYLDCFGIDSYLINGVNLRLKMFRNRPKFVLMSEELSPDYKVQLLDVVFKACKVSIDSGILISHAETLVERPISYPFVKTDIKMNTIPANSGDFQWDNIWSDSIPSRVYVFLVKQSAVNGSYDANPFNFQHFNLSEIGVYVNGESIPGPPLRLDFGTNANYASALANLYEGSERWNKDQSLVIDRERFAKGYAIYAFNLQPCDFGGNYINLIRQGNVRLRLTFATAPTSAVNAVVFGEYSALLEIDHSRNVRVIQS